jgi:pyridoxal phosphate enzyme (YggS family)
MALSEYEDRLGRVLDCISAAAGRSNRSSQDIVLIGVSKRKSLEEMQLAYAAGLRHFGENRAQEVRDKFPLFDPESITRHFIGHLQTNKVKYLPGRIDMIHSVDSKKIADAIDTRFGSEDISIPVLVEINISGESSKEGVQPEQMLELSEYCAEKPNLDFRGLMTIGPLTSDETQIRKAFTQMRRLLDEVSGQVNTAGERPILSMGMSSDFEIAIEEGATHVRVGTAIFGPRAY